MGKTITTHFLVKCKMHVINKYVTKLQFKVSMIDWLSLFKSKKLYPWRIYKQDGALLYYRI